MPMTSIVCGLLLILVGIVGYVSGMSSGHASATALIPAAFGILLAGLGAIARAKPDLSKHLMHAAIIVALLGFIAVAARVVPKLSELTMSAAVLAQISMGVICLVFVILAIRSFAAARSSRT